MTDFAQLKITNIFFYHTLFTLRITIKTKQNSLTFSSRISLLPRIRNTKSKSQTQGPVDERNTLTRVPPDPRERVISSQLGWEIDMVCRTVSLNTLVSFSKFKKTISKFLIKSCS